MEGQSAGQGPNAGAEGEEQKAGAEDEEQMAGDTRRETQGGRHKAGDTRRKTAHVVMGKVIWPEVPLAVRVAREARRRILARHVEIDDAHGAVRLQQERRLGIEGVERGQHGDCVHVRGLVENVQRGVGGGRVARP